jgi:hypothetical protein
MADAICQGVSSGFIWSKLSTGTSFTDSDFSTLTYWCGATDGDDQFGGADFNGDGKTDIWCHNTKGADAGLYVAYSNGADWVNLGKVDNWYGGKISTGDFNGDGRTDFFRNLPVDNLTVKLSKDGGTFTDSNEWSPKGCNYSTMQGNIMSGDFNADGKTDLVCSRRSGAVGEVYAAHAGSLRGRPDILEKVENGYGGTTDITYTPSSDWTNTNNPPITETVIAAETSDGRGWAATTTYEYYGGKIDRGEGKYLGFSTVTVKHPKISGETYNPRTVTRYHQRIEAPGLVDEVVYYDSGNHLISKKKPLYSFSGDGVSTPYKAQLDESWSYQNRPGYTCSSWPCPDGLRYMTAYFRGAYGLPKLIVKYGNFDAAADETTTLNIYTHNESDYITGKIGKTVLYEGIGTEGRILKETEFLYDGNSDYADSPIKGQLTKTRKWNDSDSSWVGSCTSTSCIRYDSYGNVEEINM